MEILAKVLRSHGLSDEVIKSILNDFTAQPRAAAWYPGSASLKE